MRLFLFIFFLCFSLVGNDQKRYTISQNSKLAYQVFGKGFPVLIINGGPGFSSEGFASLAKILSENNTTIIYDQRGTGDSGPEQVNADNISIELMVEDIENLRKSFGFDNWVILGHSFGGMLAYAYAAKYPERVKAMIQSHSRGMDLELLRSLPITSRLSQPQRDSLAYYSAQIREGDTTHATALKRGRILAKAYLFNQKHVPEIAERLTQGNSQVNSLVWADMRQNGFDTRFQMMDFSKPVLILNGEDEAVLTSISKKAHEILPNSKLVIMKNCGHYGWLDRPDVYLRGEKIFEKEFIKKAALKERLSMFTIF